MFSLMQLFSLHIIHRIYFFSCKILYICGQKCEFVKFSFSIFVDRDYGTEPPLKWDVYVTGHSLGGALATLLALELSSGQLVK